MKFKTGVLGLVFVLGCAKGPASVAAEEPTDNIPQADLNNPTFQQVLGKVFEPKCLSCHGAGGRISLDSYASVKPNVALIREVVAANRMPPARVNNPLSAIEKDLLLRWIDQGALDN